jgi:UDP-N-acetylmuramate dehydrogenase
MRMLEDPSPRHVALPREEGLRFVAWSGISLPKLVRSAAKLGWSGLQGLAGVPGNVGGGVAMNAGGSWGDMWDVVERLLVVDENAQLIELTREQCQPGYRNARLRGRIVASALLRFELSEPRTVEQGVREYLQKKNAVQPVTLRSAGQLVEQAGGKGRSVGGAIVSEKHGNFVVNTGTASAADVLRLIGETERLVADKTGIQLEREVKVWRSGVTGA